jgi:hypothetical protein
MHTEELEEVMKTEKLCMKEELISYKQRERMSPGRNT